MEPDEKLESVSRLRAEGNELFKVKKQTHRFLRLVQKLQLLFSARKIF